MHHIYDEPLKSLNQIFREIIQERTGGLNQAHNITVTHRLEPYWRLEADDQVFVITVTEALERLLK